MLYTFLVYGVLTFFAAAPASPPPAENESIFLSQDQGQSWHNFGEGLPAEATASKVLHHNEKLYLVTNRHGVFIRTSAYDRWQASNAGLPENISLHSIAAVGQTVVVGSFDQGVFISRDGGVHWKRPFVNVDGGSVRSLLFHEGTLLAGTDSGVYLSSLGGHFWQRSGDLRQVNGLYSHQGQIYASRQDGLVRSQDGGKTWRKLFTGRTVADLAVEEDMLYAYLFGVDKIIRSADGGETWDEQVKMLPHFGPVSLIKARWSGYTPTLPDGVRAFSVQEIPQGWFASKSGGC